MPIRSVSVTVTDPDHERELIEDETKLLYSCPQAGPRMQPCPRRALPAILDDWRVVKAVRFMEKPLDEAIRLKDVATNAGLSPHHFQRYFKKIMGESPSAYRRRVKLDHAALHLWITDRSVVDIAFMAGYASHEAFVRGFYAQFGRVPSEYRQHARRSVSVPTVEELERVGQIRVLEWGEIPLLAMRFYGPYANVEAHWQHFADYLRKENITPEQFQAIGIAYDSPEIVNNDFIRYDCAIVTRDHGRPRSALARLSFNLGTYGTLEHHAPYNRIFSTYRVLSTAWLPMMADELRMELTCAYEFYHEAPWRNAGGIQRFDLMLPVAWRKAPPQRATITAP